MVREVICWELLQPSVATAKKWEIPFKKKIETLNDNRHFISAPCNEQLATIIQYTKDKTPEQISNEILDKVKMNNMRGPHHL